MTDKPMIGSEDERVNQDVGTPREGPFPELIDPMNLDVLAPGVRGYTMDLGERGLYVPLIQADTPGQGDVGRYLDGLPTNRRIVFPTVLSAKLAGMLVRRGFSPSAEWAEDFQEWADIFERPSASLRDKETAK